MVDIQVSPFPHLKVLFAVLRRCVLGCLLPPSQVLPGCISGAVWVRAPTPIPPRAKARLGLAEPFFSDKFT